MKVWQGIDEDESSLTCECHVSPPKRNDQMKMIIIWFAGKCNKKMTMMITK